MKENKLSQGQTASQNINSCSNASTYAVVVGGINVDIGGKSNNKLVDFDSNPGKVSFTMGGVGRNIAHNISLMGMEVKLLSAFGNDINGQRVAKSCKKLGIDASHVACISGENTSTYLYIADDKGEMRLAISDMDICNCITPDYLSENVDVLNSAKVIVADCNIPEESLEYLAKHCKTPLFVDPVSTAKAQKLASVLPHIHTLKPNRLEAEVLSGVKIDSKSDVEKAAQRLLELGVCRVFISLGGDGVYCATRDEAHWMDSLPCTLVNTTGCGDAFISALAWAYAEDLNLKSAALAGLAAGSVAIETQLAVNPQMSKEEIKSRMAQANL